MQSTNNVSAEKSTEWVYLTVDADHIITYEEEGFMTDKWIRCMQIGFYAQRGEHVDHYQDIAAAARAHGTTTTIIPLELVCRMDKRRADSMSDAAIKAELETEGDLLVKHISRSAEPAEDYAEFLDEGESQDKAPTESAHTPAR